MSERVGLVGDKDHHNVHDGSVKLKTDVGWTNVEDGAEDALENHADAHGIETAVVVVCDNKVQIF